MSQNDKKKENMSQNDKKKEFSQMLKSLSFPKGFFDLQY